MTTTFKVVEFYRNSIASSLNGTLNNINTSTSLLNGSLVSSPIKNGCLNETASPNGKLIHSTNSLGFNVVGGYLTDIPATIYDLANSSNGKLIKVKIIELFKLE